MSTPRPKGRYVQPSPAEQMESLYPGMDLFPEARVDPTVDADRRYTTPETMALCMKLAGVEKWTMDVAADQESHWAEKWYGIEQNGLVQPWFGDVFCNPPFSDIAPWLSKAWAECDRCTTIAMLLPANRTEQAWFHDSVEPWRDGRSEHPLALHFLPSRVRYGHPGNKTGHRVGSPPFGSMLLVWRSP